MAGIGMPIYCSAAAFVRLRHTKTVPLLMGGPRSPDLTRFWSFRETGCPLHSESEQRQETSRSYRTVVVGEYTHG